MPEEKTLQTENPPGSVTGVPPSQERPPISDGPEHGPRNRPGVALAVIATCYLMVGIDSTIVNIALPNIRAGLDFSEVGLAWVINSYLLAFGGLLLLGGRLGDVFGRRRVLVIGTVVFTLASLLGGLAIDPAMLIVARALQGVGAALAAPGTLALIATNFAEGAARNKALSIYSATAATGTTLGLILGGLLTSVASWRLVQFVNIPIGVTVAVLAPLFIRETDRHADTFDFVGTVTGSIGVVSLVYGFIRVPDTGWTDTIALLSFALALVVLIVFLIVERRVDQPIVPLRLFADRQRASAYGNMLLFTATILSLFYFLSQFIQNVLGFSAIQAGLAFLPMTLGMFAVARTVPKLLPRFGPKPFMVAGALLMTITAAWLSQITADDSYVSGVLGPMLLFGVGAGCCLMPTNITVLSGVAPRDSGSAAGVLQTTMQLGGAVGLAILVTVFGTAARHAAVDPSASATAAQQALTTGVRHAFAGATVFTCIALLVALFAIKGKPQARPAS